MNRFIFYCRAYVASVFLFIVSQFFFVPEADARISESRVITERRLTQAGGIVYRDEAIKQSRRRGMPYMRFYDYYPEMAEVAEVRITREQQAYLQQQAPISVNGF